MRVVGIEKNFESIFRFIEKIVLWLISDVC